MIISFRHWSEQYNTWIQFLYLRKMYPIPSLYFTHYSCEYIYWNCAVLGKRSMEFNLNMYRSGNLAILLGLIFGFFCEKKIFACGMLLSAITEHFRVKVNLNCLSALLLKEIKWIIKVEREGSRDVRIKDKRSSLKLVLFPNKLAEL